MSRFIAPKKVVSLPFRDAFAFLTRCIGAKIDMTSAIPISQARSSVLKFYQNSSSIYRPDLTYLARGRFRGEEFALEKVANFFKQLGINCDSSNISFNSNVLSAIAQTYGIIGLNKGGKILVPTPTFGYYFQQFADLGIDYKILPTKKEEGFLVNPKLLKDATDNGDVKALLLCYPNNPSGVVMPKENAQEIAEICKKRGVFVISDEIFLNNRLSLDKHHTPIAAIDGMLQQSITFFSPSKSMGFPARRTSICLSAPEIVEEFAILGGYSILDQKAIVAAIENNQENQEYLEKDRQKYLTNIEIIKKRTSSLNKKFSELLDEDRIFVQPFVENPEAGNVYLLDFSGLRGKNHNDKIMKSGLDVANWMLEEASVAVVPGECSMFAPDQMLVRIALGHPTQEIEQVFDLLEKAVGKIKNVTKSPQHVSGVEVGRSTETTR